MKQGDPESIKDFKKSGDLSKGTHNTGAMNLSVVIMYLIVGSFTNETIRSKEE